MFAKSKLGLAVIAVLAVSDSASARYRWLERDDRAVLLHPRRFGQENPAVIQELSAACPGQVCGTLAGAAITPLLAAQPECSQQDMADQIIDAAQQFDDATKQKMIDIAVRYRQAEKNTPPGFDSNPPTLRNSVFCQKAPKNPELNGLVQAQDPANDPNLFFDPATKATVTKGSQPNTEPFGGAAANTGNAGGANNGNAGGANNGNAGGAAGNAGDANQGGNGGAADSTESGNNNGGANTGNNNGNAGGNAGANNGGAAAGGIGDFGSCSVPEVEFGVGFDNRKETSFQPVDKTSFDHGSAQGFGIISKFICDTLTNKCKADQAAKDTCAKATAAADAAAPKTGAQADAFNAAFGITTNFANVQPIDDQGRPVGAVAGNAGNANNGNAGANTGNAGANNGNAGANNGNAGANNGNTGANNGNAGANNGGAAAGGIGDFGSCSVPEVEFGVGFDNRKETSFQPVDKASYNHESAQNFGIISQFICDTLTNKCGADQTAKDTCAKAIAASNAAPAKTGAQADAFNAAFGKTTNFSSVQAIDNQGKPVV